MMNMVVFDGKQKKKALDWGGLNTQTNLLFYLQQELAIEAGQGNEQVC